MSTTGRLGANPDQLDELAARMSQSADMLEGIRDTIRSRLDATLWSGDDGDQFRMEWRYRHTTSMTVAVTALRESSHALRVQSIEQRRASGADSGPHGHHPVPGVVSTGSAGYGPTAAGVVGFTTSTILDLNVLKNVAPLIEKLRLPGVFSAALLVNDVIEAAAAGWDDEHLGEVTLGVVSTAIGLGAGTLYAMGSAAVATGVGAPVGAVLIAGGVAFTGVSIGISAVSTFVPGANELVGGFVRDLGEGAVEVWNAGGAFIDEAVDAFRGALEPAGAVVSVAGGVIGGAANAVGGVAADAIDAGRDFVSKINPFD